MIEVFDNFLPDELYAKVRAQIKAAPMKFGSKSNGKNDPHGHWSWKPVHDDQHNLAALEPAPDAIAGAWQRVQDQAGRNMLLIRNYVNGYTYGTDGYFHRDSQRADERTCIIYVCDRWTGDWAGETVLKKNDTYTLDAVLPWPNRAVIFDSNIWHAARAVSRLCPTLRTTLIYKMRPQRSAEFERLSAWLVKHGALKHDHATGTLHDHLVRVFAALEARLLPMPVCFGGGLHSVYGTSSFPHTIVTPDAASRSAVATAFGSEAEALAYMFSVLDRPSALEKANFIRGGHDGEQILRRVKLRYDQKVDLPIDMFRKLAMIEGANLDDQNAFAKWPNLKKFWDEGKLTTPF